MCRFDLGQPRYTVGPQRNDEADDASFLWLLVSSRFISFHLVSCFGNRDITREVPVFDFFASGMMFGKPSLLICGGVSLHPLRLLLQRKVRLVGRNVVSACHEYNSQCGPGPWRMMVAVLVV